MRGSNTKAPTGGGRSASSRRRRTYRVADEGGLLRSVIPLRPEFGARWPDHGPLSAALPTLQAMWTEPPDTIVVITRKRRAKRGEAKKEDVQLRAWGRKPLSRGELFRLFVAALARYDEPVRESPAGPDGLTKTR